MNLKDLIRGLSDAEKDKKPKEEREKESREFHQRFIEASVLRNVADSTAALKGFEAAVKEAAVKFGIPSFALVSGVHVLDDEGDWSMQTGRTRLGDFHSVQNLIKTLAERC